MFGSGKATLPTVSVEVLQERLGKGEKPFILDVREPSEFQSGHIDGATLIPLGSLASRLNEVPKDKPVVVVCRSGNRSGHATSLLLESGFKNVENMAGGMIAWDQSCPAGKIC